MRLFLIALLALPVQDDPQVGRLIEQLEDDSFDVREQAQSELVRLGEAALPALRKASAGTGELKVRADAAIREIELAVKGRQVFKDPRTVTLDAKHVRLADLLKDLSAQTGLRFDASAVDAEAKVSLSVREAPLFRVLDELCRGQEERTFEHKEEGLVKLIREKHLPFPAAFSGPFRVRLVALKQERSTDFKERKYVLHVTLDADHEKYLKPSKRYSIDLAKAADDTGAALEVKPRGDDDDELNQLFGGAMRVAIRGMRGMPDAEPPSAWTLRGLAAGAKTVTLSGTLRYTFPLDARDVAFDKVQNGETRESGDYAVKLERVVAKRSLTIQFRRTRGKPEGGSLAEEVEQRLDADSLTGIDDDGNEHKGQLLPTGDRMANLLLVGGKVVPGDDSAGTTYQAMFPTLRGKGLKELKFRFVDSTLVKAVPFRFERVELP
jgi:hypothetical protein